MSPLTTDTPGPIRKGEALPIAALSAYLKEALSLTGELTVAQYPSGFSNLTYALTLGGQTIPQGQAVECDLWIHMWLVGRVGIVCVGHTAL